MKHCELISIVKSFDVKKATSLDGLTAKMIKSATVICQSLLEIINASFKKGVFPDPLKLAKILPIHKGEPKSDPSNYRPLSILSFFLK